MDESSAFLSSMKESLYDIYNSDRLIGKLPALYMALTPRRRDSVRSVLTMPEDEKGTGHGTGQKRGKRGKVKEDEIGMGIA
jgi:hypothetical protein